MKSLDELKDVNLTIAFIDFAEPARLVSAVTLVPQSFLRLREKIQEKHFTDAKKNGASAKNETSLKFSWLNLPEFIERYQLPLVIINEFGFDFRNLSRPIFPPAPLIFSTIKDFPVLISANLVNFRANKSTAPPAVVGTIITV